LSFFFFEHLKKLETLPFTEQLANNFLSTERNFKLVEWYIKLISFGSEDGTFLLGLLFQFSILTFQFWLLSTKFKFSLGEINMRTKSPLVRYLLEKSYDYQCWCQSYPIVMYFQFICNLVISFDKIIIPYSFLYQFIFFPHHLTIVIWLYS
jgi:hypothetical protein